MQMTDERKPAGPVASETASARTPHSGTRHFDVLIVGAGLSGISAAYHLQKETPDRTYAILEGRAAMGGTWDLFRYPGIRSDSDMYTLGYSFKPWTRQDALAAGPLIRDYVKETAEENGIDRHIRFNHRVKEASWSSAEARWTVKADRNGAEEILTCDFLWMCSGYYRYAQGFTPDFPGRARFKGTVIHPQKWPEDLDYSGKRVVIIGSGATAITLVPAMADKAAHVTMLQRSPTYVFSMPSKSTSAGFFQRFLPAKVAYFFNRLPRVLMQMLMFYRCRTQPEKVKAQLIEHVREHLGPDYDVAKHFTPKYAPWDQRLCFVTDEDLFKAIKSGKASVETDQIETFTEDGIRLKSGTELKADIVVTATGLDLEMLGGANLSVDGKPVKINETLLYRGLMLSDVPNMAFVVGYNNASWTLRADLVSEYVCRLLQTMDAKGADSVTPRNRDPNMAREDFWDFSSSYVQRAKDRLPRQGAVAPWRYPQNYFKDMMALRYGRIDDGVLAFEKASTPAMVETGRPVPAAAE